MWSLFLCSKRSNFHGKPTDVIPDIWEVGNFQRFMVWCTHFDYIKIKSSLSAEKKMPASFFMSLWFLSLNFHAVTAPRKTILWLIINASQTIIANWCFIMISKLRFTDELGVFIQNKMRVRNKLNKPQKTRE